MGRWNFDAESPSAEYLEWHEKLRRRCRRSILQMTHLANSGHPGGSLSSLDLYLVTYAHAEIDPTDPWREGRDRIVVSHGHTSPGVYSVLAELGFVDRDEAVSTFRSSQNVFEGHIEREVPGVEWTTGNLGQGLSAACGMALASRLKGEEISLFVPMGDGEQQKGQIAEARRFARKYSLTNITAIIDWNRLQISGGTDDIMPQDISAGWRADGWVVSEIDGHDPEAIYHALREAKLDSSAPHVVVASTVMGHGVSFMENRAEFHGRGLTSSEYEAAVEELGEDAALWDLDELKERRKRRDRSTVPTLPQPGNERVPGDPITYEAGARNDNRSAFGTALQSVAHANVSSAGFTPFAAFDCDLEGSVKLGAFHAEFPDHFFQAGIQEHHTATCAGALSAQGITTVFADFGVFGVCETYNQHRLTDINHGELKLACTHVGLDVGEDGKTHQCIDYVGMLRNIFGMRIIVPADPNQTDRAVRHMLCDRGMYFIGMGRSKMDVITSEDGSPFFGDDYLFEMGCGDWIRRGSAGVVVSMGSPTGRALEAVDTLRSEGLDLALAHLATPGEIDVSFLDDLAEQPFLVTVEDHSVRTGLGACLSESLFSRGHTLPHLRLGVEEYAPSGTAEEVYRHCGLDSTNIRKRIQSFALQTS
ncbi:MAG TPA: transketolase [Planctomycetes bacterium]|nr:transketolase [Planctomycetota bacterium]